MTYASIHITYVNSVPNFCLKCWGTIDPVTMQSSRTGCKKLSYKQAMQELRKLERRLHKTAELDVNLFDHHICKKTIWGWVKGA